MEKHTAAELYAMAQEQEKVELAERLAKRREEINFRAAAHNRRCEEIAAEYNINEKQAIILHSRAYEDNHAYGYDEVEEDFKDLCILFNYCLKA